MQALVRGIWLFTARCHNVCLVLGALHVLSIFCISTLPQCFYFMKVKTFKVKTFALTKLLLWLLFGYINKMQIVYYTRLVCTNLRHYSSETETHLPLVICAHFLRVLITLSLFLSNAFTHLNIKELSFTWRYIFVGIINTISVLCPTFNWSLWSSCENQNVHVSVT